MEPQYKSSAVNTPYDDVFRTMLNDCSSLIIPVINEVFSEQYTGEEEVVLSPETHYINQQDGDEVKRITDGSFIIRGKEEKRFLCECQSTPDSSMLVRIFEYSTQIALDQGEIVGNVLKVEIPRSAVLFLRSNRSTPDNMVIEMKTPGGTVCFDVMVLKAQRYSIDDIFDKGLLFLIPFYIFSHESRFAEYDADEAKLETLKNEYGDIVDRLDALQRKGQLSAYTKKAILEMAGKVVENIAKKFENVREGVKSVMGGRVLEYEAKTILRQGIEEGIKEGKMEQARETAFALRAMGLKKDAIEKAVNVNAAQLEEWFLEKPAEA